MTLLLALFPIIMLAIDGFNLPLDLGGRLSAKNITLGLALLWILLRLASADRFRLELPTIHWSFCVLLAYAVLTWWTAGFIIEYKNYPVWENAFFLKLLLGDYLLIFLAFFYGPQTEREALSLLKVLLVVVTFGNVLTVADTFQIISTSYVQEGLAGRTQGLIGEANQYAAFNATFLPAFLAMVGASRGLRRACWIGAAVLAASAIVLALSRGAIVGMILGSLGGVYLLRRQISAPQIIRWGSVALVAVMAVTAIAAIRYGDLLYARLIGETGATDIGLASAGRTLVWVDALRKMAEHPQTFITGFGWRVYWALPHALAPHNTYLNYWFNLGIVGLGCFITLLWKGLTTSAVAASTATSALQPHLMAFVFGVYTAAVALFFVDWLQPWAYFWIYYGLVMRLAVLSKPSHLSQPRALTAAERDPASRRDAFGWVVHKRRSF